MTIDQIIFLISIILNLLVFPNHDDNAKNDVKPSGKIDHTNTINLQLKRKN